MGDQNIFVKAFIITIVVFAIGLWLGVQLSQMGFNDLKKELSTQQQQFDDGKNALLFFQNFQNTPTFCDSAPKTIEPIVDSAKQLGDQINELEKTQGFEEVLPLKKEYSKLLAEEWLYVVQLKKACPKKNFQTILYFYSNKPGACNSCRDMGSALWGVRQSSPNPIWVFSFEFNQDLPIVEAIKKQFDVNSVPTLVIDEKTVLTGNKTKQELEASIFVTGAS